MKTPVTNIPIPAILEIGNGAVFSLNQILKQHGFTHALFLFDDFTYNNHRPELLQSITSAKVQDVLMPRFGYSGPG